MVACRGLDARPSYPLPTTATRIFISPARPADHQPGTPVRSSAPAKPARPPQGAPKNDENRKTSAGGTRLTAFVADPRRTDHDPARRYAVFRDIIRPFDGMRAPGLMTSPAHPRSASPGFSRNASCAAGFGRPIPSAPTGAPLLAPRLPASPNVSQVEDAADTLIMRPQVLSNIAWGSLKNCSWTFLAVALSGGTGDVCGACGERDEKGEG